MLIPKFSVGKIGVICTISTITSLGILYAVYRILRSRNDEEKMSLKWRAVGKLKSLYMYPLKSGHRYEIQDAHCTVVGLHKNIEGFDWGDSCFVVYNPDTMEYKTAQQHPALLLVNIKPLSPGKFGLSTPDAEEIEVDFPQLDPREKRNILANETDLVSCWDCGDFAAEFISMVILKSSSGLRLGYCDRQSTTKEELARNRAILNERTEDCRLDVTAYHLVTKTSVDKLNKELEQPVTEHYFRPNFYVHGHHIKAWEEDDWEWIRIGGAIFRNLNHCSHLQTTAKNKNEGLLKTLEKVALLKSRKMDHSIVNNSVMGEYLQLYTEGNIRVNDQVYVACG